MDVSIFLVGGLVKIDATKWKIDGINERRCWTRFTKSTKSEVNWIFTLYVHYVANSRIPIYHIHSRIHRHVHVDRQINGHTRGIYYTRIKIYTQRYIDRADAPSTLWFFKRIPFSSEYLTAHTNFLQNWNGRFSRGWHEIRKTIEIRPNRTNAIVEWKERKRSLVRRSMHTRTSTEMFLRF